MRYDAVGAVAAQITALVDDSVGVIEVSRSARSWIALVVPKRSQENPIRLEVSRHDCWVRFGSGALVRMEILDHDDALMVADIVLAVIRGQAVERFYHSVDHDSIEIARIVEGDRVAFRSGDDVEFVLERRLPAWR